FCNTSCQRLIEVPPIFSTLWFMALSSLGHRFGTQLISTVFIVYFVTDLWRIKDTGHGHLAEATQQVLVVLIQNVQRAGFDRVYLVVGNGLYFTFAAD